MKKSDRSAATNSSLPRDRLMAALARRSENSKQNSDIAVANFATGAASLAGAAQDRVRDEARRLSAQARDVARESQRAAGHTRNQRTSDTGSTQSLDPAVGAGRQTAVSEHLPRLLRTLHLYATPDESGRWRTLVEVCTRPDCAPQSAVRDACADDLGYRAQWQAAREMRAQGLADQALTISDDDSEDIAPDGKQNAVAVARARLRTDVRIRLAAVLAPRQWGERQQVDLHTDASALPDDATEDELDDRIAVLAAQLADMRGGRTTLG